MEVACNLACLRSTKNMTRISIWDSAQLALLNLREQEELRYIIDHMGVLSAQAQHLRTPITDYNRLKAGSHTLYLCSTGLPGKPEFILAKGMLKVGQKNLYIRKDNGKLVEMAPTCVLDFYVHESCQRMGLGHELFEAMLVREKKRPRELGYDRPSSKLHSFLAKYYGLKDFLPQANQFVVFKDYFYEQASANVGRDSPVDDWGKDSSGPNYLLERDCCGKDKVLHGRRATNPQQSTVDRDFLRLRKIESGIERTDDMAVADPCTSQQQLCGRRQSGHQMTNIPGANKVSCSSKSIENQKHHLSYPPVPSERDDFFGKNFLDEQKQSTTQVLKIAHGRRNSSLEARKMTDIRYFSPPSLPKPFEDESKHLTYCSPSKLSRRDSTRARLFHEGSYVQKNTTPQPTLKCPFWTKEGRLFDSTNFDASTKPDFVPIPATFQKTRSCYHAGMRGYQAAEAIGYSGGLWGSSS